MCCLTSAASLDRVRPRLPAAQLAQPFRSSNAACAAATARSTSSLPPSGAVAIDRAGGRVDDLERLAVGGIDRLAADDQPRRGRRGARGRGRHLDASRLSGTGCGSVPAMIRRASRVDGPTALPRRSGAASIGRMRFGALVRLRGTRMSGVCASRRSSLVGRDRERRVRGARLAGRRRRVHDRDHAHDRRLPRGPRARRARSRMDDHRCGRGCRDHLRFGRGRRRGGPVRGGQRTRGGEANGPGGRRACAGTCILCGYGRVGSTVARELAHAGERVRRRRHQPDVARLRPSATATSSSVATRRSDAVLAEAGIDRARGLITTIDSDANNVYVTLSARALNPKLFIVARANETGSEAKLLHAGADRVVSPYSRAGRQIAELAVRPQGRRLHRFRPVPRRARVLDRGGRDRPRRAVGRSDDRRAAATTASMPWRSCGATTTTSRTLPQAGSWPPART